MKLLELNITRSYKLGLLYTFVFLLLASIGNYYTWSSGPVEEVNLIFLFGWLFLYTPFFIYSIWGKWEINEFGFIVNYKTIIFIIVLLVILSQNNDIPPINNWNSTFIEIFARMGEELFFRGFLYVLFLKIFNKKKKPWIGAVIISSILFAIIHTQTFLPDYENNMIDIFNMGVFLALLRKWSGSILPGALLHILVKTFNIYGCILGIVFYLIFISVAYFIKKEKVFKFKSLT